MTQYIGMLGVAKGESIHPVEGGKVRVSGSIWDLMEEFGQGPGSLFIIWEYRGDTTLPESCACEDTSAARNWADTVLPVAVYTLVHGHQYIAVRMDGMLQKQ